MATTRSKKSGDSKSVEKKQVEAPKSKEVKEAPKPVEKKAAVSNILQVGSYVLTPAGKECKVLEIIDDFVRLERVKNKKTLIVNKEIIKLVGEK